MHKLQRLLVTLSIVVAAAVILPVTASAVLAYRNASLVSTSIPQTMVAGSTYKVTVKMKNTGRYTWVYSSDYKLRARGGSDPFTKTLSYRVAKTDKITTGRTKTFTITMKAPSKAGVYTTDWRMHRGTLEFGPVVSRKVTVVAPALTGITLTKVPNKVHYLTGEALDLTGLVVTGAYNNGTKAVVPVTAAMVTGFNTTAVTSAQTLTITVGGKTVTFVIDVAEKKPVISAVHIESDSAKGHDKAYNGDTITLTFTSDEPVEKLYPGFKINSSNPDSFTHVGNVYTAKHLVDTGDPITGQPATFQINVKNAQGFYSQTIEVTNDGSSVTIVDEKPVISNVKFSSNSQHGENKAQNGDILTLTFTSDEPVEALYSFRINSSHPDSFTHVGNVYTATHLVDSGDPITGEPATFQINVKNARGIYSQTIEATNDGSAVTIVRPIPVISDVHIESNSAKGSSVAATDDIITLTFTSDMPVEKLSNFKINGSNPDSFTNIGNVYTATHKVDSGDPITGQPATFQINVKNESGIFSQTVEATNDHSSVTIVDEKPVISNVHVESNGAKGADKASSSTDTNGDIITVTFTTDEPVTRIWETFKINDSRPNTFTDDGNNHYTATHLVDSGDHVTGNKINLALNVQNAKGVASKPVYQDETFDGSQVFIVDPKPVISNVHITSNSSLGTTQATDGDIITLTFTSDEPVEKLTAFKLNGSGIDPLTLVGGVYSATHLVDSGDPVTGEPATFQINVKNAKGIYSLTIEATSDGSFVKIVRNNPV